MHAVVIDYWHRTPTTMTGRSDTPFCFFPAKAALFHKEYIVPAADHHPSIASYVKSDFPWGHWASRVRTGGGEPSRTGEESGAVSSEGSGEYSSVSLREGGSFGLIVGYQCSSTVLCLRSTSYTGCGTATWD